MARATTTSVATGGKRLFQNLPRGGVPRMTAAGEERRRAVSDGNTARRSDAAGDRQTQATPARGSETTSKGGRRRGDVKAVMRLAATAPVPPPVAAQRARELVAHVCKLIGAGLAADGSAA